MKIYHNGKIREMTTEEIAEMERLAEHIPEEVKTEVELKVERFEKSFELIASFLKKLGLEME